MKTIPKSGPQAVKRIVLALASAGLASLPQLAPANPVGGQVVAGTATISQETPSKVAINQTSAKAIVDWRSFSIGAGEQVQFRQPSASAATLNRVVGEDPSKILGRLSANGQVFLVNPNGIYFGKNSQIDVAGLVASTHNIRNEDFMAGKYVFNLPGKPGAAVINEGTIRIADTGIAAFVGASVANRGVIVAKLGKVALAAANGFTLDFTGDKLLTFLVGDEVAKTAFDVEGKQLTSFVENSGKIEAQGGYVLLTAKAAENAIHGVINQSGVIEATTVGTQNGEIILNAGKGSLYVSGTLDASAPKGGDGGFIETSGGHVSIDPGTRITTAAPLGKTGRWLIDPTDFRISSGGGDISGVDLANYLGSSNIEIQTLATGNTGQGDIFVDDVVTWNSTNKLTLTAYHNIYVNQAINAAGGGSVKLRADSAEAGFGTVTINPSGHITANGAAAVGIYYNPVSYADNATKSDSQGNRYSGSVTLNGGSTLTAYMLVNDVNHLQAMSTNLSGRYALGKNIDANATAGWNSGAGFAPVSGFSGLFDGQGHIISNLTINRPAGQGVGLFGTTSGATIRNVGLEGGIVNGLISVGGLVGGLNASTITNSYSNVAVTGSNNYTGGLVGYSNNSTISNAYATGSVNGANFTGGLVGGAWSDSSFSNAYATGSVSGALYVGGLLGVASGVGLSAALNNVYATGSVAGVNFTGGLLGWGVITARVNMTNSYATGRVSGGSYAGGLVGILEFNDSGNIVNSYWDTETSGQSGGSAGVGLTSAQMKQQASFSGWDFNTKWQMSEGVSKPTLKVASAQTVTVFVPGGVAPPILTPAQSLLVQQHQNDNPAMLLNAIGAGLFLNSTQDPVWVGMYQNGSATQAQVSANSLWATYDQYRMATASRILEGLGNGDIVYGGTIWTALGSPTWGNLNNRNAAYYTYTHAGQLAPLTAAQQIVLTAHSNDSTFQLLLAIADGLFSNSSLDPIWVGMYQNGSATAVQVEANRLRNLYDEYTPAALFSLICAGQLRNDSNDATWHSIYRNGRATAAQVAANTFAQTYDIYKGTTANTLFDGIVSGEISPNSAASNAVVWQALVQGNLSGTTKAAYMAGVYNTLKGRPADHLFYAIIDKQLNNDSTDSLWRALYVDGKPTQAQKDANAYKGIFDIFRDAGPERLLQALKDGVIKTNGIESAVWETLREVNENSARIALANYMTYLSENSNILQNDPTRDRIIDNHIPPVPGHNDPVVIISPGFVDNVKNNFSGAVADIEGKLNKAGVTAVLSQAGALTMASVIQALDNDGLKRIFGDKFASAMRGGFENFARTFANKLVENKGSISGGAKKLAITLALDVAATSLFGTSSVDKTDILEMERVFIKDAFLEGLSALLDVVLIGGKTLNPVKAEFIFTTSFTIGMGKLSAQRSIEAFQTAVGYSDAQKVNITKSAETLAQYTEIVQRANVQREIGDNDKAIDSQRIAANLLKSVSSNMGDNFGLVDLNAVNTLVAEAFAEKQNGDSNAASQKMRQARQVANNKDGPLGRLVDVLPGEYSYSSYLSGVSKALDL
jgi:filamentous hemagglutinin family protein